MKNETGDDSNVLSEKKLSLLQQCLIELMVKDTHSNFSDFVLDMQHMNKLNVEGQLTGKYIFLVREMGTEFGRPDYERITFEWGSKNVAYQINFDVLRNIVDVDRLNFMNLLRKDLIKYEKNSCVVERLNYLFKTKLLNPYQK